MNTYCKNSAIHLYYIYLHQAFKAVGLDSAYLPFVPALVHDALLICKYRGASV